MFIDFPEIHTPIQGIDLVPIPNMVTIRQSYDPIYGSGYPADYHNSAPTVHDHLY